MTHSQVFYFFLKWGMCPCLPPLSLLSLLSSLHSVLQTYWVFYSSLKILGDIFLQFFYTRCFFCLVCSVSMPSINNFYSPSLLAWVISTYASNFSIYIHFLLTACVRCLSGVLSLYEQLTRCLSNFHPLGPYVPKRHGDFAIRVSELTYGRCPVLTWCVTAKVRQAL